MKKLLKSLIATSTIAVLIVGISVSAQGLSLVRENNLGPNDYSKFKIETWKCKKGTYKQDFEPTQANMNKHFPGEGLSAYQCPVDRTDIMVKETNPTRKIEMSARKTATTKPDGQGGFVVDRPGLTLLQINALKAQYED